MSDDYDEGYSEIAIVRQMHELPHLDSSLQSSGKDFDISYDEDPWNSYTQSLLTVPIICGAVAIALLLFFEIYLLYSCCFSSRKARNMIRARRRTDQANNTNNDNAASGSGEAGTCTPRRLWMVLLIVLIGAGALACTQLPLFGNAELNRGVDVLKDGLDYIEDVFIELTNDGDSLTDDGNTLLDQLDTAANTGCPEASNFDDEIEEYLESVEEYLDFVEPIPDQVSFYHDGVDRWGVDFKNDTIWILYAVMMVTIFMLLIGAIFQKSRLCVLPAQCIAQPMLIIYFILVTVEMAVLIGWADFCMEPKQNLLNVIPRNDFETTSYYITCEGENPFQEDLDDANEAIEQAEVGVDLLLATICSGNAALESAASTIDGIQSTLDNIESTAECEPTQDELDDVLYDGFCKKAFRGVYDIWLGQYLAAAFLLTLLLLVSLSFWGCFHFGPDSQQRTTAVSGKTDQTMEDPYATAGEMQMVEHGSHRGSPTTGSVAPMPVYLETHDQQPYDDEAQPATTTATAGQNKKGGIPLAEAALVTEFGEDDTPASAPPPELEY